MGNELLESAYVGKALTVTHCNGAIESFDKCVATLNSKTVDLLRRKLIIQINRLADGGRLPREQFPPEGSLPNGKNFWALKHTRVQLRGYTWISIRVKKTYFISHYIYKKAEQLAASDVVKVCNNWKRIEEQEHEC